MKYSRSGRLVVAAASVALLVAACGGGGSNSSGSTTPTGGTTPGGAAAPSAASGEPIKIGVSLPLSGPAASSSQDYAPIANNQAKLGNATIDGRPVQVILRDDQGSPDGGASAVRQLLDQDKVDVILGTNITAAANTEIPLSTDAKKLQILWSGCPLCGDGTKAPYAFSLEYDRPVQGPAVIDRVKAMGKKKVAILQQDEPTGQDYTNAVTDAANASNGAVTISKVVKFPLTALDLTTQVSQIKADNPDVVYLAVTVPSVMLNVLKAMKEIGYTPPLLSTSALSIDPVTAPYQGDPWTKQWQAAGFSTNAMRPNLTPEVSQYRDLVKKVLDQDPMKFSMNQVIVVQDGFDLVKAAIEGTHSTDGPTLASWIEKNGFKGLRADYTFTDTRHNGLLPKDVGWAAPSTFKDGVYDEATVK